jgi:DNA modification methylase
MTHNGAWRSRIVGYGSVDPRELTANPRNWRTHPDNQRDALHGVLDEVGWVAEVLVNQRTGFVVDGHLRVASAVAHGEASVPVRYIDLDEAEERLVLATLDPLSALATRSDDQLTALLEGLQPTSAALRDLLRDLAPPPTKVLNPDDADLTPPAEPVTQPGDLWLLGEHRLLCGDSTNAEDVVRLMDGQQASLGLCDPPYNVGEDYERDDDHRSEAEYELFSRTWFANLQMASTRQIVTPGCYNLARWCRYFDPYHVAPWTKSNSMTNGKVARWWCWEPIMFYGDGWARRRSADLFDFPISEQSAPGIGSLTKLHPCPKPLAMWVDLVENYADDDEGVVDLFGGVGPVVIACEQLARRAFAMEHEPSYCDVIVRRWETVTGRKAERIGAATEVHA